MSKSDGCPIREDAEQAVRLGQDFNRGLRGLRQRMAGCWACREGPGCALLAGWNSQVE